MPVMDCLPIYYAERTGMFREAGIDVRLAEYHSQMDCDTAIQRGRVEMAYTDVARVMQMEERMQIVMGLPGRISLVTARTKRIRQLKHLNERMVALDRLSMTDYQSDLVMKQAGLDQAAIYRPQINDVQLRASMLSEQLMDAALLPEPYATAATLRGNRILYHSTDSLAIQACMAVRQAILSDTMRMRQIRQFIAVYNKACECLNHGEHDHAVLRSIFRQHYGLSPEICDSLSLPTFPQATMPRRESVSLARQWLQDRERHLPPLPTDSLFCNKLIP